MNTIDNSNIVGNTIYSDSSLGFKSETVELFSQYANEGLSLIENMGAIVGTRTNRSDFVDSLTESVTGSLETMGTGVSESNFYNNYSDRVSTLIDNSLSEIAKESVMFGYSPIVAYNPFFIKKEWIENIFKDVLMSEVPKTPKIEIGFQRHYLVDQAGNEYALPEALYNTEMSKKILDAATGASVSEDPIAVSLTAGGLTLVDPTYIPGVVAGDVTVELTPNMYIFKAIVEDSEGGSHEVPMNMTIDVTTKNFVNGKVSTTITTDSGATETISDELMGRIDYKNGKVTIVSTTQAVTHICIRGKVANRYNKNSVSVERRVENHTKMMPESGPRINCAVTVEEAADALALQNVDMIADNISIMGATLAAIEDGSIKSYLEQSFEDQKAIGANTVYNELGIDSLIVETGYNLLPYDGYAGSLSNSIPDLKIFFEQAISSLKLKLRSQEMVIVAVANPNTVRYLNDINWVFTNDTKISGVKLQYNFGIFTTAQDRVHVVTSQRISEEEGIRLIPIPLTNNLITFKNYRYSTVIDRGYRNPVHDLVPNIMATQRTLTFDIIPVQGHIAIESMGMFSPNTLVRPTTEAAE